jgi:hypothetical protein
VGVWRVTWNRWQCEGGGMQEISRWGFRHTYQTDSCGEQNVHSLIQLLCSFARRLRNLMV